MNGNLELFINAKNQNRLSHLYLLTGKKSLNKLELAYEICFLVLKDYDSNPNLLNLIKNNEYPQVITIKPDGTTIKKDQILELQQAFSKTSLINGPRFYIIENVDVISIQAANSLLKFMEEPDNNLVYGILTTSNVQSVLSTIISRSQVVRMKDIENKLYQRLLEEGFDSFLSLNIQTITNNEEEAIIYANDDNFKLVINYVKNYFTNFTNVSYKPIIELNNSIVSIIINREMYLIFLELMLFNYSDLLKYILTGESQFEYEPLVNNISSENILKDIKLIQEEIKRQRAYININLSVDTLMISLKRW